MPTKQKTRMRIDHIAIWCDDIEAMRTFYTNYFACTSAEKYFNPTKLYTSYFLTFDSGGARIELMHRPDISSEPDSRGYTKGVAHICIEVGSELQVRELTERLRSDGYTIASECRTTGDGYYESGILDPEGNYVEISA